MAKRKKNKRKPVELEPLSVKQERFLRAYATSGANIAVAAKVSGCDRTSHYYWLANDPDYPEKFRLAREEACDVVRAEIYRRGVMGIPRAKLYRGNVVLTEKEYSDRMLELLAKSMMPEEFRERVDVNQSGSQDVKVIIDENWYGNNAHSLPAEGDAASIVAADE